MKRKLYLIYNKNLSRGVESFAESVINKIDLVQSEILLDLVDKINQHFTCREFFFISALNGDGVIELKNYIVSRIIDRLV